MNTRKQIPTLLAIIATVFSSTDVWSEISEVRISVEGLACPFCVYGVEKHLKRVEGVGKVTIDLETGIAIATLVDSAAPDLTAFSRAVEKAGFTPGEMKVIAIGKVVTREQTIVLLLRGSDAEYQLFAGDSVNGGLSKELREKLSKLAREGATVAISGTPHPHKENPDGLSVDDVSLLSTDSLSFYEWSSK